MNMDQGPDLVQFERISPWRRKFFETLSHRVCLLVTAGSILLLVTLMGAILYQGIPRLSWKFLTGPSSADPDQAGILGALVGSTLVCLTCAIATLPLGVGTAIFLEEYKPRRSWISFLHGGLELLIANLAGVPSVVYGLLGLSAFVHLFGLFGTIQDPHIEFGASYYYQYESMVDDRMILIPAASRTAKPTAVTQGMQAFTSDLKYFDLNLIGANEAAPTDSKLARRTLREGSPASPTRRTAWYFVQLPFGYTVLSGALTLMLVVLPVVIISSQEAIRAVPSSLRSAALGLGCTRWQVVWNVTLPSSLPGIMTGAILAMSRAIGEAAPILMVSGALYLSMIPKGLMSSYTVMPLQIYQWADDHNREFSELAASGIIVLLVLLLALNLTAVLVRQRAQKRLH